MERAILLGILKALQERAEINGQIAWNFRKMGFGSRDQVGVLTPSFASCT